MNAIVRLLSNPENTIPIQAHSRPSFLNCLLTITLLVINITRVQPLATLSSITPSTVPFQGGTIIYANGTGFESVNFPKCQIHTNHGVLAINDNTVINDTTMQCILPQIPQVYKNSIITSGNSVVLKIISGVDGSVQISFFDLDLISVYSITPSWTYISDDDNEITVHGNGFIETYEITCHSTFFDVEAVIVNTTQLMCLIPGHRETQTIDIDIYSVGQPTSIIQETNSISFTYFATPPEVVFFEFDPSYTRLLLEFDREIELGNETDFNTTTQPKCQTIIKSLDIFGSLKPFCYWQNTQQRQIIVELNNDSTVKSNTTITLIDDIIRTRYVSYSKLTSGIQLVISNNNYPLNPIAVIDGPQIIPYCGNFTLSGRKSYNTGGRPLQYQWTIETMDDQIYSGEDEENQIAISNLVPDDISNQQSISLSSDLFHVQTVYYLSLTVTNFLGNTGSNELLVIKHDKPALNVMIIGSNLRLLDYTRTLIVEGATNLPDCLTTDSSHTTFEWVLYQNEISIDLNDATTTNSNLQLEGYTLEQNATYLLSFMATQDGITSTANITVRTISTKIRAIVFGGTAIKYGADDSILLDATNTVGLIDDLIHDNLLRVQWTCLTKPDLTQCVNITSGLELALEERIKIIMPPNILSPAVHVISLRLLYSNELISEYQQVIHIVNDTSGPLVFLEEPTDSDRISIHNMLTINGIVESILPGEAAWSSVYKPGYAYLSLNANNTNTPLTLSIDSHLSQATELLFTSDITIQSPYSNCISLSILSDGYLLPNNQYCFRLTVTTSNNRTRFSEIEIHTATHPSTGDLSMSPLTGVSLKTVFHITATDWADYHKDFPLYYRMGLQATDGIMWLTTKMEEDSLMTILPSGDPLIVVLEVSDSYGATTTLTKDIIVSHSEDVDLLHVYNHIRHQAFENGNLNEAFAYLVSTLCSINSKTLTPSSEMTFQDFKYSVIDLIVDLYKEERFTPNVWLHQMLVQILSSVTFDTTSASSIIPLIEEIVQYGSLISDTQNGGQDVVNIYSNLIESSSTHDVINARVVTDEVTESFGRMFSSIGHSACQQMPVFSPSRYIINQEIGSIKLYNSLLQTSLYLTCDNTFNNDCPFSKEDQLTVSMSEQLLESLADLSCQGGSSTINKCSSYCMTSLVLLNDFHWVGSEYASIVKSHPIRLHLVLSDNDMEEITNADLAYPIDFYIPLKFPRSSTGHLKCVHWNEELNDWSDKACSLFEENSNTVHCRCEHLNEIAVIDICPSGYYGMNCDHICPYGLYGELCLNECQCSEMGLCSPLNGSCDCSPGWTGDLCDLVCPTGVWGKHCSRPCQCQNEGVCDSVNGGCDCPPGWIGSHCEVGCPEGFYGDNCSETCQCHSNDECDFVSGNCTCEPGYTGPTCHTPCESGYYGENCTSLCSCEVNGTAECDNVNGTCYCLDMWLGDDCEVPPYIQPPVVVPSSFPVVIVATPVGLGVLAAVIVVAFIVLTCVIVKKHRRTKSAVFPISEQENGKNSIGVSVESKGDSVMEEIDGEEEDELELTRAKSRNVLIPDGKTLNDLFSKDSSFHDFKEPEQIGTKRRWQIVQILPSVEPSMNIETPLPTPAEPVKNKQIKKITEENKLKVESGIEIESIEGDEELGQRDDNQSVISSAPSDGYQEIVYKKGIFLDTNGTLKDLRNGFIDSSQIDSDYRFFQFLNSDMPGDYIPIDNEEDTLLSRLEPNLISPKTMYIETVDNNAVLLELCVCGKFAELECTECRAKGYCCDQCQQDHWLTHSSTCRIVSARRRHTKKMKRKRKKFEKMMKRTGYTPQPDKCVCGGIAQYECSECGRQGYCSEKCQVEDWELHQLFCKQL